MLKVEWSQGNGTCKEAWHNEVYHIIDGGTKCAKGMQINSWESHWFHVG